MMQTPCATTTTTKLWHYGSWRVLEVSWSVLGVTQYSHVASETHVTPTTHPPSPGETRPGKRLKVGMTPR